MEPIQENGKTQALAVRDTQSSALTNAYEPRTIDEARSLAADFAGSKLTKCRTKEQALLIMATGAELGIPATTALRMIYVADFGQGDQVTLSADLMVALCLRSPLCEYFEVVESTNEKAIYRTKRKGRPERTAPFTIEDKERAKLGKVKEGKDETASNWAKYPATMLRHRAASMLAREVYPDVIGGFYTLDEARDIAAGADYTAAPVSPLPTAVDAEFTETQESDEQRIVRLLDAAATNDQVQTLAQEAVKIWPNKSAPAPVKAAHIAAKDRVAKAATAKLVERQPGEDG